MKAFRNTLPNLSLGICLGFLAFLVIGILVAEPPETPQSDPSRELAFQASTIEGQALFTRQAVEGEMEDTDTDGREESSVSVIGVVLQSKSISDFVPILQSQQPVVSPPGKRRAILFGQLII